MLRTLGHQKLKGLRTSSRSRRRRNPDAPPGYPVAKWKDALSESKREASLLLLGTRAQLVAAGLPVEALPEPFELNKRTDDIATILASSQYADLALQSKLNTPSKDIAAQILSVFEKVAGEKAAKPVLTKAVRTLIARLDVLRAPALAKRKAAGAQAREATAESEAEESRRLEKELASLEGGNEGEEEGDVEREEDADVEIDFLYALSQDALSGMSRKDPRRKALIAFVKAKDAGDVDAIRETVGPVRDIADTAPDMPDAAEEPEVAERSVPRTRTTGGKEVRRAGQAPSPRPVAQGVAGGEQREDTPKFEGELSRAGDRLAGYDDKRARVRVRHRHPRGPCAGVGRVAKRRRVGVARVGAASGSSRIPRALRRRRRARPARCVRPHGVCQARARVAA